MCQFFVQVTWYLVLLSYDVDAVQYPDEIIPMDTF